MGGISSGAELPILFPCYGRLGTAIKPYFSNVGWAGVSAVLSGLVPLDILYPRGDKGDNRGLPAVAGGWVLRGS